MRHPARFPLALLLFALLSGVARAGSPARANAWVTRLGFSYPEMSTGVSLLGAGPLQPAFTRTPRAGPKQRDEIYRRVYGGDATFHLARSPWAIVERQAGRLGDVVIRRAIGDRDETFANNVAFHERMRALGAAHTWSVAPGVGHDPTALIRALGDAFWAFHRAAFGAAAESPPNSRQIP